MNSNANNNNASENSADNASTIVLTVPGMTCGHCESAVKTEVGAVPGVSDVTVDLDSKLVSVIGVDLDRDRLVEAIDEAGFDVE